MDYTETLTPLISYVAHLAEAMPTGIPADDAQIRADLRTLIERAHASRHRLEARGFDMAWFAVAAWAEEKLRTVPGGQRLFADAFPERNTDGGDFFERLDFLLNPAEGDGADAWRTGIIETYALCLELRFSGRFSDEKSGAKLLEYRHRCRKTLENANNDGRADLRHRGRRASRTRQAVRAAIMWTVPVLVTVALYSLYRAFLADLYAGVLG